MRTYALFTYLALASILSGCTFGDNEPGPQGPRGPQGPAGPSGPSGPSSTGLMYEIEFDLIADNEWQASFAFPEEDEIFLEDVVLVYLLWEQTDVDGEVYDVWRLMPVSYFTDDGLLQINFDFTALDVVIFAEAAFDLDPQRDAFNNIVARIVVVPADFSPNARTDINYEDFYEVQQLYGLPEITNRSGKPFLNVTRSDS